MCSCLWLCPCLCLCMLSVDPIAVISFFPDTTWFAEGKLLTARWRVLITAPTVYKVSQYRFLNSVACIIDVEATALRSGVVWLCPEDAAQSGGRGGGGGQKTTRPASPAHSAFQPQRSDWVQVNTCSLLHTWPPGTIVLYSICAT